jgi:hypothetical protein
VCRSDDVSALKLVNGGTRDRQALGDLFAAQLRGEAISPKPLTDASKIEAGAAGVGRPTSQIGHIKPHVV